MQIWYNGLNSVTLTTEVIYLLECDKQGGGSEILNDNEIIYNVTGVEEVDVNADSVLNQKPTASHSKQKQRYQRASTGLKNKRRQVHKKLEPQRHRRGLIISIYNKLLK